MVTWYWRQRNEVLGERPVPVLLCLYGVSWYRIRASCESLATKLCAMALPIKLRNKSPYGCNFSYRWLSLLCWPTHSATPASCRVSSSMIETRVHLMTAMTTFSLQLSTATELVVTVGCVSIAGDRSTTWWRSGTLWQVVNLVAS